jgi:hypothetical protein
VTVAATNTAELNIGQIILQAYQQASLMELSQSPSGPQWDARAAFARGCLTRTIQRLGAEGPFMRQVEFYPLTLTAGTATYTLPSDTIDVIENAVYNDGTANAMDLTIRQIDREEWLAAPDKVSQATPFRMFVNRGSTITVTLLQVPDTTGAVITLQRQKLAADIKSNSDTPDVERYWTDALVWELAHMVAFASSLPMDKCGYLRAMAKESRQLAMDKALQQTPNQLHLVHMTGWGN